MSEIQENDYSMMIATAEGFVISLIPILGQLYGAAVSANVIKRLQKVESKIIEEGIDCKKLKNFIESDEGHRFFMEFTANVIKASTEEQIAVFVKIMGDCYDGKAAVDVQYKTAIMQTISGMTVFEMLLLVYIIKYFEEIPEERRSKLDNPEHMEIFMGNLEKQEDRIHFPEFLLNEDTSGIIVKQRKFFFLRLINLGILEKGGRFGEGYYVTPFGVEVIKYLNQ